MTEPTLAALLAEQAGLLEGAEVVPTEQGTDYRLDEVLFASLAGDGAEFRLRDEVGAAALRTPGVAASTRGDGWVRFAPTRLDGHARDRALAWFESAWRRADAELTGVDDVDAAADELDDDPDPDDDPDLGDDGEEGEARTAEGQGRESRRPTRLGQAGRSSASRRRESSAPVGQLAGFA